MPDDPGVTRRSSERSRRATRGAAWLYASVTCGVVGFQMALAAGAPWGRIAMGGVNPGALPPSSRVAALVQAALLAAMAGVVLARAGVVPWWARVSRPLVWGVVAITAISFALNLLTPSASERALWAPVAGLLLCCSVIVARSRRVA
jgi:hypothetical protein